jgi:hypothetical protein
MWQRDECERQPAAEESVQRVRDLRTGVGGEMSVDELIVMLREYSERGSEEDFAEAAGFLEAFQYENKEYRKQMTTQVARIKSLEKQLLTTTAFLEDALGRTDIENPAHSIWVDLCEVVIGQSKMVMRGKEGKTE